MNKGWDEKESGQRWIEKRRIKAEREFKVEKGRR